MYLEDKNTKKEHTDIQKKITNEQRIIVGIKNVTKRFDTVI